MVHNHRRLCDMPLRRFVALTDKNEYIVLGADNIEAGYRAINLAGLVGEELKDVIPCSEEDTRQEWTGADYDQSKDIH
jgi:hypothetical protein